MRRVAIACVVLVVASLLGAVGTGTATARFEAAAAPGSAGKGASDVYVVVLEEPPVAAYEGGVAGIPPTRPAPGRRLDKRDANVQRYVAHLRGRHADVANRAGAVRIYDYE